MKKITIQKDPEYWGPDTSATEAAEHYEDVCDACLAAGMTPSQFDGGTEFNYDDGSTEETELDWFDAWLSDQAGFAAWLKGQL